MKSISTDSALYYETKEGRFFELFGSTLTIWSVSKQKNLNNKSNFS